MRHPLTVSGDDDEERGECDDERDEAVRVAVVDDRRELHCVNG